MARTMSYTETLVVEVCWCGINHAIPSNLARQAAETGQAVYCPLGHQWVITETEVKKLRAALEREQTRLIRARNDLQAEVRSHSATKGQLTKTRKRAANGVCPCCNRSFVNVARHVAGQHPEFVAATAAPAMPGQEGGEG